VNRLIAVVLVGACVLAQAAGRNRDLEALSVLEAFFEGTGTPNQVANRVEFLSAQRVATEQLVDHLRRSVDPVRRGAMLEVLAQIAVPSDDADLVLMRALADEPLGNRMAAAKALGRVKSSRAAARLEAMLADRATGARREAARALGAIGKPTSGQALMTAAHLEDDIETAAVMLMAIGGTADRRQINPLEPFLSSSSESARLAAARSLCALGASKGQAFAKRVLASADRLERLQGIGLLEGTSLSVSKPLLTPMLTDADAGVRAAAARVLAQAGDASKRDWLIVESAKSERDLPTQLAYENEIAKLRVSDEARAAILKNAGLL
jgi:HEAT repeat protein